MYRALFSNQYEHSFLILSPITVARIAEQESKTKMNNRNLLINYARGG